MGQRNGSVPSYEKYDVKGEIVLKSPDEIDWAVPGFFSFKEKCYCVVSPSFQYLGGTWHLKCLLGYWIHLCLVSEHCPSRYTIEYRLGIRTEDGAEYIFQTRENIFEKDGDEWGALYLLDRFTLLDSKDLVAPRGIITFFGILRSKHTQAAESQSTQAEDKAETFQEMKEDFKNSEAKLTGSDKLLQDLKNIFNSGSHYDTIIKVRDEEIRMHKVILSIRSPVFASNLKHQKTDKKTCFVTDEDCEPKAFRKFIFFLYSGEMQNITLENVTDLYFVAHKYKVEEVASECVKYMMKNISVETFCNFISLAIRHSEKDLLNIGTEYFLKNVKSIIETHQWQYFEREYPVDSNKLYINVIKHLIP